MAMNRPPTIAPRALLGMSKTTLADIVWQLAGTAPGVASCDNEEQLWRVIRDAAERVRAPRADMRVCLISPNG